MIMIKWLIPLQCVSDLKSVHRSRDDFAEPRSPEDRPPTGCRFVPQDPGEEDNDENDDGNDNQDDDRDMEDAEDNTSTEPSPIIYPSDRVVHSCTTSPNIFAQGQNPLSNHQQADPRRFSATSSVASPLLQPLNQTSNQASPAVEILASSQRQYSFSKVRSRNGSLVDSAGPSSALTSPALRPQGHRDDQEATEALLMLNSADRRSWSDIGKRGMSVKDLLSG